MAKIVRIRLYRVQDYDLYAIYYDKKNFRLSKMFTAALSAFANGRPLPVFSLKNISSLPKPIKADNGEVIRGSGLRFTLIMSFSIPDYDTKAIALIDYLTKEQTANSFLKTLVRRCFTDMEYMYLEESVRAQFPDPGSMVMSTTVQASTDNGVKKPRKRRTTKPKQTDTPSIQEASVNNSDNSHIPASENKSAVNVSTTNTAPNKASDAGFLSGAEPSYVIDNHATHKPEAEATYSRPTQSSDDGEPSGNDLFSFAQGFEF